MRRLLCFASVCFALALQVRAQSLPFYVKGENWQETFRLSREQLQNILAPVRAKEHSMMGSWNAMGPYVSRNRTPFAERFLPEFGYRNDQQFDTLRWIEHPEWNNGNITALPFAPWSATYLFRILSVRRDTSITFYLGSNDGLRFWINGRLLVSDSSSRQCAPNQDSVTVPLHAGTDSLMLKLVTQEGSNAFYFSTVSLNKEMVWDIITHDYTRPDQIREMSWERSDGIYDEDWTPGDFGEIGRRYARAYTQASEDIGIDYPPSFPRVASPNDLAQGRVMYLVMRRSALTSYVQAIPKETLEPRINGTKIVAVRPGHSLLYRIPASGKRPMTFDVTGLPAGLSLNRETGQISGIVQRTGDFKTTIKATNSYGSATRDIRVVVQDRVGLTPPLGWSSRLCTGDTTKDAAIRAAADAMIKSGLATHGWSYVTIDDNWSVKSGSNIPELRGVARDERGRIRPNGRFPDMAGLSRYLHDNGLKIGLSSSPGQTTCGGFTGSYQHEIEDARQFGDWEIDYLQYDWCSYASIIQDTSRASYEKPFRTMRVALDAIDRDVLYCLNLDGLNNTWEWGESVGGNSWRIAGNMQPSWESISRVGFGEAGMERYAGPGHWNDPGLLSLGWTTPGSVSRPSTLSASEQISQMTLWSLLAAPLFISCDMNKIDDFTFSLLANDEVLAVDQDALGRQAHRVLKNGDLEVWAKELEDGSQAIGFFNRGTKRADVAVQWSDLGLKGTCTIRDLWKQKDLGSNNDGYTAGVSHHGAVLIKVTPEK
jgi:alpha-galactosidase